MSRGLKVFTGFLLTWRLVSAQGSESGPQPKTTLEDLVEGQRLFGTQCAYCHGPQGEGGQGPVLARRRLSHAPDDQALFRVIHEGIPETRMPASALTTGQIWRVAAYVRSLGRIEGSKSAGNPRRGEQIYAGKGACARCHTIGGHGGAIGPDLADIGARKGTAFMRTSLLDPDASVPLEFLQVHVVTKDGRSFTGVRVNEDSFSLQIRDLSNQFHSFWKSDMAELVKEPKRSLMPGYGNVLTKEELDDLVAYLESLENGR